MKYLYIIVILWCTLLLFAVDVVVIGASKYMFLLLHIHPVAMRFIRLQALFYHPIYIYVYLIKCNSRRLSTASH